MLCPDMDWDNVRVFLAVARAGQFVAAARRLKVDHATASRRVAALEAALGAKLFERGPAGALLTEAGRRLLAHAERMESDLLLAQGELGEGMVELAGDVRIGAPDGFATFWLVGALADFLARHPGVRLQIAPMPQTPALARRDVEIAIVLEKPAAGRFVARKLVDYSLGIYGSADYLAREGAPADAAGLARHRLIGYVGDLVHSPALGYVGELFGGAPTRLESASAVTQFEAVRAGVGLGVVHDYIARRFPDLVRVLPERTATRTYWIVTHEDTRGIGRVRAAHDALVARVEADRRLFAGG